VLLNAAPELRAARHLFAETERQQETLGEADEGRASEAAVDT